MAEKLPGSFFTPGRPDLWQIGVFLLCLGIIIGGKRYLTLLKKWVLLAGGILVLLFPWPKTMTITFLDVGQGDCIHIRSGSGQHFLIDGGSSDVSKVGEYRLLPYLKYVGAGRIEAVFVTHPDADHMNGIIELLSLAKEQGIVIARLYLPDVCDEAKTEGYRELEAAAGNAGVPLRYLSAGQMLKSKDISFTCLHPAQGYNSSKTNEYSMVLMLTVGRFHSLFTGDVENEGEAQMLRLLAKWEQQNESAGAENDNGGTKAEITVLKVAHHGSAYTTSPELLSLLKPRLSVISCGKNNAYGHPHEETLMRLAASGSKILTTPQSGAVTIEVGRQVKVYEFNGK